MTWGKMQVSMDQNVLSVWCCFVSRELSKWLIWLTVIFVDWKQKKTNCVYDVCRTYVLVWNRIRENILLIWCSTENCSVVILEDLRAAPWLKLDLMTLLYIMMVIGNSIIETLFHFLEYLMDFSAFLVDDWWIHTKTCADWDFTLST